MTTCFQGFTPDTPSGSSHFRARQRTWSDPDGEVGIPGVDAVVADERAGVRRLDELAATEREGHVVDAARSAVRAPEVEVARPGRAHRDRGARFVLRHRVVRKVAAGGGPRLHGQPRAVPRARACGAPLVRLAELCLGEPDRPARATA